VVARGRRAAVVALAPTVVVDQHPRRTSSPERLLQCGHVAGSFEDLCHPYGHRGRCSTREGLARPLERPFNPAYMVRAELGVATEQLRGRCRGVGAATNVDDPR